MNPWELGIEADMIDEELPTSVGDINELLRTFPWAFRCSFMSTDTSNTPQMISTRESAPDGYLTFVEQSVGAIGWALALATRSDLLLD